MLKPLAVPGSAPSSTIPLKWRFNEKPLAATGGMTLEIQRKLEDGRMEVAHTQVLESPQKEGALDWKAQKPGNYVWQIKNKNLKVSAEALFSVEPHFTALELLEPLISGEATKSNFYQGKRLRRFDLTLRWKPYSNAKEYLVELSVSPTFEAKLPRVQRKVAATEALFNDPEFFKGQLYYRVSTEAPNGFIAASPIKPVEFNFLPPVPVTPLDHKGVTQKSMAIEGNSLLFTWRKTNFTEEYEIEISQDAEFKKGVVRRRTPENFFVLHSPAIGQYWWRVKSFSKSLESDSSQTRQFQVLP